MSIAWPVVKDRLVEHLPAVLGEDVRVYDGPEKSGDKPTRFITVGHQPSTDEISAGSYEQSQTGPGGFSAEERGTVLCEIGARNGEPEMPDAFGMAESLAAWVQSDQTLGVLGVGSTASVAVAVVQSQKAPGAVQRLLISVSYFTRV